MTREPWWRDARGMPPRADAARARVFSARRVKVLQALLVGGVGLGVLMLVTGHPDHGGPR